MNITSVLLSTLIFFFCSQVNGLQVNGGYGSLSLYVGHANGDCDKLHEGQKIPTSESSDPCLFCVCRKQILESFPVQIRYKIICNIRDCPAPGPGFCREDGECCPSPPPCSTGYSGKHNIDSKNGWRYIGKNYGYENNGNNNGNGNIGSNNGNRNIGSNNGNGNMGSNNGNDNIGRNNGNGNIGSSNGNGNIGNAHGPWYGGYGGYNDRYGGYGGYAHKGISSCLRDNYYNYGNFFLSGEENHQPTILHCQKQCAAHPNCSLWTYGKKGGRLSQQCYLKHSASGDERYDPALIEGPKNCTPNMYDDKQFNPIMITNTGCTGLSKKQCKKNAKCNWVKYFRFGVKGVTCSWKRE